MIKNILKKSVIIFAVMLMLLPVFFILINSFISGEKIYNNYTEEINIVNQDELNNKKIHFVNFSFKTNDISVLGYLDIYLNNPLAMRVFLNSLCSAIVTVFFNLVVSLLGAYGLFLLYSKNIRRILLNIYLVLILLPLQVLMVPQYFLQQKLNLKNPWLIIVASGVFSPISVFILFFAMINIPKEIIDAAVLDGASSFNVFKYIIIPLAKAGIIITAFIMFTNCWNIIEQAVVFIKDDLKIPMSLFLNNISLDKFFPISSFYLIFPFLVFWNFSKGLESSSYD